MERNPSPQNDRRGCLCPDGTYSRKCCDGSFQAQGIGSITMGEVDSAGTITQQDTTNTVSSTSTSLPSQGISLFPVVYVYGDDASGVTYYSPVSYKDTEGETQVLEDTTGSGMVNSTATYTDKIGESAATPYGLKNWQIDTDFPTAGTFIYDFEGTPIDNRENYYNVGQSDGYPSFSYFNTDRFIILESSTSRIFSGYFRIYNIFKIGNVDGALKIKEQIYNTDTTGLTWKR